MTNKRKIVSVEVNRNNGRGYLVVVYYDDGSNETVMTDYNAYVAIGRAQELATEHGCEWKQNLWE